MDDREKDIFIIGDVHGCWYTYSEMLGYWNPENEILIQLGDLVDRGNFSHRCLIRSQELEYKYPEEAFFLKGNHEHMMLDYLKESDERNWMYNGGKSTLTGFAKEGLDAEAWIPWLEQRELYWQNGSVFVSHAGIGETVYPFDEANPHGVLWTRGPLKDIGKLQVIGHTPQISGKATYRINPPCWNIDTGAFRGICLTGLKLNCNGKIKEEINIPTDGRDIL